MIMAIESVSKFPLSRMSYLDLGLTDLFEEMLAIKRGNCPNWTDESASDPGVQLLWLFSVLSQWLVDHMERVKDNSYIGTTTDRESMRRLCELLQYQLSEAVPATATLTLTHTVPHSSFTINKGQQFSTSPIGDQKAIVFELLADVGVPADQAATNISVSQGETYTNRILGSSDGKANQAFHIDANGVVWASETITVGLVAWTRVDTFVDSGPTDTDYRIEIRNDNDYYIVFGDGTNGKIPAAGSSNVRATYRTCIGSLGNVGSNTITKIVTSIPDTTAVTNATAASGGADRETIAHARLFAPASIKTLERAVSIQDIEDLCNAFVSTTHGGIAVSKALVFGGVAASVMVVPKSGGSPSSQLKSQLQSYLDARRVMGTSIQVINPRLKLVSVSANVYVMQNYSETKVASQVRKRLVSYLSPTYQDPSTGLYQHTFGRDIRLSDLYRIIDSTPGVDYCTITAPTGDTNIANYEIADVGDINLTISTPSDEVSYFSDREDILDSVIPDIPPIEDDPFGGTGGGQDTGVGGGGL